MPFECSGRVWFDRQCLRQTQCTRMLSLCCCHRHRCTHKNSQFLICLCDSLAQCAASCVGNIFTSASFPRHSIFGMTWRSCMVFLGRNHKISIYFGKCIHQIKTRRSSTADPPGRWVEQEMMCTAHCAVHVATPHMSGLPPSLLLSQPSVVTCFSWCSSWVSGS